MWFEYFPDSKLTFKPKVVIQQFNEKISQTLKLDSEVTEKFYDGKAVEIYQYLWFDEAKTIYAFENLTNDKVLEQFVQFNLVGCNIAGESGDALNLVLGPAQVRVVEILRQESFALEIGKSDAGHADLDSGATRPRATNTTLCVDWPCKIRKSDYKVRQVRATL